MLRRTRGHIARINFHAAHGWKPGQTAPALGPGHVPCPGSQVCQPAATQTPSSSHPSLAAVQRTASPAELLIYLIDSKRYRGSHSIQLGQSYVCKYVFKFGKYVQYLENVENDSSVEWGTSFKKVYTAPGKLNSFRH